MTESAPYALLLIIIGAGGLAVHETCHYVAARLFGTSARFGYVRNGLIPNPCVWIETREHTTATYRLTVLAPLVVFVPTLVIGLPYAVSLAPGDQFFGYWFIWLLGTMPSPPDWRMAYHAGIIDDTQAGRQAPHSNHATAEGYA